MFPYSPDLIRDFQPIAGMTGDYVFTSVDFTTRATLGEAVPVGSASVRWWHRHPRRTTKLHSWVEGLGVGDERERDTEPRQPARQDAGRSGRLHR